MKNIPVDLDDMGDTPIASSSETSIFKAKLDNKSISNEFIS